MFILNINQTTGAMKNLIKLCMQFKPKDHLVFEKIINTPIEVNDLFEKNPSLTRRGIKKTTLTTWIKKSSLEVKLLYVLYKDPDDRGRNDGWGGLELHQIAIIKITSRKTEIMNKFIVRIN